MSAAFYEIENYLKTLFPEEAIWTKQFYGAKYLYVGLPEYEIYFLSVRLEDTSLDPKANSVTIIELDTNYKELFPHPHSYELRTEYTGNVAKIKDIIFIYSSDINFALKKFREFDFKAEDKLLVNDLDFTCLNKKTRVYESQVDDTTITISFPYYISLSYMLWIINSKVEIEKEFRSLDDLLEYIVKGEK